MAARGCRGSIFLINLSQNSLRLSRLILLLGVLQMATSTSASDRRVLPRSMLTGSRQLLQGAVPEFLVLPRTSVDRHDIECGQPANVFIKEGQEVHFCKLCGGAAAVADACKANSKCVAFVMEDEKCGYLKASVVASAQYRSQPETLYCMSSQPDCTGAEYIFHAQTDLKGVGDYSCNYKEKEAGGAEMPFCFVRGNLNAAADACNDDAGCVAFVTGSRYGVPGAYLKNVVGPASRNPDTSLYLKPSGIDAQVAEVFDKTFGTPEPATPQPEKGIVQSNTAQSTDSGGDISQISQVNTEEARTAPADTNKDSPPTTAEAWGPCGPQHHAKCPSSQCCSATLGWVCGVSDAFCNIQQGCSPGWGSCNAAPKTDNGTVTAPTLGQNPGSSSSHSSWSTGGIVGVAAGGASALAAMLGGAYTCWKWWHKRMAIEAKKQQLPSTAVLPRPAVGRPVISDAVTAVPDSTKNVMPDVSSYEHPVWRQ